MQFAIAQEFKPKDTVPVAIVDPFGNPTAITITLAGLYTPAFKAAIAAVPEGDDVEAKTLDLLVAATVSWTGVTDDGGEPVPCVAEHVRALYAHPELPWLWAQVRRAFVDTSRFFERATTSSSPTPTTISA